MESSFVVSPLLMEPSTLWSIILSSPELQEGFPDEEVIFHGPATIVTPKGGEKVVVKCAEGDAYDPRYGYLLAQFMIQTGMTRTQVSKHLKKIEAQASKVE